VQGVGSKVALGVLGVLSTNDLANAIALQNSAAVEQTPGVGKKLAQRIVAELKDKAPALSVAGLNVGTAVKGTPAADDGPVEGMAAAEAISALSNLGYNPGQASAAVAAALKDLGTTADTAQLIRRGLKELAR
jgi:Holliday junction DNA helicase RuvA